MTIIEISALPNGAHNNRTVPGALPVPDGWALVPEELLPAENFPFGTLAAEEINGVMTVTGWTPAETPPYVPPTPEPEPTTEEILDALLGVEGGLGDE